MGYAVATHPASGIALMVPSVITSANNLVVGPMVVAISLGAFGSIPDYPLELPVVVLNATTPSLVWMVSVDLAR